MASLTLAGVREKIEEQKQRALQTPIVVLASPAASEGLRPYTDLVSAIYGDATLFCFSSPADAEATLASHVHRTLVFFFYLSTSLYQSAWLEQTIAPGLSELPIVDLFKVDMAPLDPLAAKKFRMEFAIDNLPCAVVYRMGHLVDRLFPEADNQALAAQVAEYRRALKSRVPASAGPGAADVAAREAQEVERRQREQFAAEQKREAIEKEKYRQDVMRKLAEVDAERKAKGLKK